MRSKFLLSVFVIVFLFSLPVYASDFDYGFLDLATASDARVGVLDDSYFIMEVSLDDYDFNLISGIAIYDITYGSGSATAVFPLSSAESLSVTSDGLLVNTGTANVTGRLFTDSYSDTYSPGYTITLVPILTGNIFNTLYTNGHSGYLTYYYTSSGRVTSAVSYYTFYCSDYKIIPPSNSLEGHNYYAAVLSIILLGGIFVCLLRRSWS